MLPGFFGFQLERAQELDHWLESVVVVFFVCFHFSISANREYVFHLSTERADDIIVNVPRLDAQGLSCIEGLPGIRGFEVGDVEQSFVYHGKRVAHGFA